MLSSQLSSSSRDDASSGMCWCHNLVVRAICCAVPVSNKHTTITSQALCDGYCTPAIEMRLHKLFWKVAQREFRCIQPFLPGACVKVELQQAT